jgi:hypothetical protein
LIYAQIKYYTFLINRTQAGCSCYALQHVAEPGNYLAYRQQRTFVLLRFVDRASQYNLVKKIQLDAKLILSVFHQTLQVSGVSRPIIRRYNRMYTAVVLIMLSRRQSVVLFGLFQTKQEYRLSSRQNNKYNCCIHTVASPDDGSRYARNM